MRMLDAFFERLAPWVLSLTRIVVAALFLEHGAQKLFGFPPGMGAFQPMWTQGWWAGVLEFWGGALLLLGLLTRPVAFVLCGLMAVAYFMAHAPQSFFPIVNRGELAVLYCFIFLYFVFAGAGPVSVDAFFRRDRRRAETARQESR